MDRLRRSGSGDNAFIKEEGERFILESLQHQWGAIQSADQSVCDEPAVFAQMISRWSNHGFNPLHQNAPEPISYEAALDHASTMCNEIKYVLKNYNSTDLMVVGYAGEALNFGFGYAVIDLKEWAKYHVDVFKTCAKEKTIKKRSKCRQEIRQNKEDKPWVLASNLQVSNKLKLNNFGGVVGVSHVHLPSVGYDSFGFGGGLIACPSGATECVVGYAGVHVNSVLGFDEPLMLPATAVAVPAMAP